MSPACFLSAWHVMSWDTVVIALISIMTSTTETGNDIMCRMFARNGKPSRVNMRLEKITSQKKKIKVHVNCFPCSIFQPPVASQRPLKPHSNLSQSKPRPQSPSLSSCFCLLVVVVFCFVLFLPKVVNSRLTILFYVDLESFFGYFSRWGCSTGSRGETECQSRVESM